MLDLVNDSPWAASLFPGWDADRRAVIVVVVKARFAFDTGGALSALGAGRIEPADRHRAEPVRSSLLRAGDGVPFKQGGECLVHGTVRPVGPGHRARRVVVTLDAPAGGWHKRLRVTGRRRWQRTLFGLVPGDAEPLEPTLLCYEYAFGGVDVHYRELEARNPVGLGFGATRRTLAGCELPRIEYDEDPVTRWSQRPPPAGFGPVAAGWRPRRDLAAGMVEATAGGVCPYPDPVSCALFNAAPEDQRVTSPFTGGERLTLDGFGTAGGGAISIALPVFAPRVRVVGQSGARAVALACDTVEVDADAATLDLVARGSVPVSRTASQPGGWLVVDAPKEAAA